MDKDVVYLYNGILLSIKKNKILPSANIQIELESTMVSEISQLEKDTI